MKKRFKLDWVLNNELAVGPAPLKESHFEYLANKNIKSILNLCNEKEGIINVEWILKPTCGYLKIFQESHFLKGQGQLLFHFLEPSLT